MRMFLSIIVMMFAFSACGEAAPNENRAADQSEREALGKLQAEAARQTGLPNITSFTEKKFAKLIYELRDREITTYSYFMDYTGKLHFLCESIGYGLPFSVQYVNPDRPMGMWSGSEHSDANTIAQPEPNGLFMPDGLSATWVLCSDGDGGVKPIYSEPSLIVSPFKLEAETNLRAD